VTAEPSTAGRPSQRKPPLLVFVHIPKTGGTRLRAVLDLNEPGQRTRVLRNVFQGGGGLSEAPIEELRRQKGPKLHRARLVRGHVPLGIRDYLPQDRELRCFTFLREPVDRTLSHFFQVREMHDESGPRRLPTLPADATLDDAVQAGLIHDNLHTRMLSGLAEPFGEVSDDMLERAKQSLREGLAVFGLTERFDESLVLLKRRLGFHSVMHRSRGRVNATRPRADEVPPALLRAAEQCNRHDIELYRYAEELFDAVPERGEEEFEVDVAALRAARSEGEIEDPGPAPASFGGDDAVWRMLIEAKATVMRLEWRIARRRIPPVPATVQEGALESELKAARADNRRLGQQVERLEATEGGGARRGGRRGSKRSAAARPKRDGGRTGAKPAGSGKKRTGNRPRGAADEASGAASKSDGAVRRRNRKSRDAR
jgi:hypothetical protein